MKNIKNYSFTFEIPQLRKLKKIYKSFLIEKEINNKNIYFFLQKDNIQMIAYNNGTFFIKGENIQKEILNIKEVLNIKDYSAIGSDEVGTGDVFGSIVVCSSYVTKENIQFLENLNIKDSKKLTDEKIIQLVPQIINKITYSLISINPYKYNILTNKGFNLNKIKAILHNDMILKNLIKIKKNVNVILDKFTSSKNYFNYLKNEKKVYKKIFFCNKAEKIHISVAVSSIIARYAFLKNIFVLSEKIGIKLKLGASKEVDKQINFIYKKYGMNILKKIAKCNFKNITKQFIKN
ncbi:ribonuclease HIII [Candidatus Phytoplasma prunorum]|uniref:ribonuclease HIII n=1 Tax=Candidatus Phytoplasma prunorum TaxID=47565 RepID=UPI002FF3DDB7